ncbi:phosphate ABC transporter substrate-binding protein PstS [Ignatzschineria sp. F8392]|uniref:phosphate ABC transporter substrate-binding protein PstS n=1 Tax=Ignatzschineria sp. F8392 TaxID=1980117 RepID=UPI000B98C2EA|nr:phosphate ABC transporter substrate-binding protein PstS [Ignatzschineria sp. F8392]OYQ81809.1 phosphate ABC transporter substrate-binding protein PstS [Ignatzschineria sp. F8392]
MKTVKSSIAKLTAAVALGVAITTTGAMAKDPITVTGAGASFPAPVYAKWAAEYAKETGNRINYQSIGSSAGVKQIDAGTVDFGATDAPLSEEQLAEKGLIQFPTVIGGVVLAINVDGIKTNELVLDGETLGDIYLGKITKWNDEAIAKLNPNLQLPNQDISVVRRADGSGTSFIFTGYLAKVNEAWKDQVGSGSTVNWPVGIGGKGNDGVTAFVQRIEGSIGYVEYAYAKQNNLSYTKLISKDGEIVSPGIDSFSAAAKEVKWSESFVQDLTDKPGKNAWPLAATTFILLHKEQNKPEVAKEIVNFFNWGYGKQGQEIVIGLDYAPLPENVVKIIDTTLKNELIIK